VPARPSFVVVIQPIVNQPFRRFVGVLIEVRDEFFMPFRRDNLALGMSAEVAIAPIVRYPGEPPIPVAVDLL
jgi:hypothetical protein